MHDRVAALEEAFVNRVNRRDFPPPSQSTSLAAAGLSGPQAVQLFESQITSRVLDIEARAMRARGEGFYTIGSAGHEGNVAVAAAARPSDIAFLHYRSGGFFIQRAKQVHGSTPIFDMVLSLAASRSDPIAGGRHKVFGSIERAIPPQTSTIASHVPKAVGCALSIPRRKDLGLPGPLPGDSIVLCSFGDASTNHATALSGFNTASWAAYQNLPLPLVFVCEDNGIGISTPTPKGWVAETARSRPNQRYIFGDGLHLAHAYQAACRAITHARECRKPVFLHLRTIRLLGHAGSDREHLYHTNKQMALVEAEDPLLHSARILCDEGAMTPDDVIACYQSIRARVVAAAKEVRYFPGHQVQETVRTSVVPKRRVYPGPQTSLTPDDRRALLGADAKFLDKPTHMAKLLNWALHDIMGEYPNTVVFGEDVAKLGGVYNVTAGLFKRFGVRRVFNAPLDETSILGTAVGMAHNGLLPIPEIQFLAYYHNAQDQIRGEAATLSFFSDGQMANPMVVRIAGLAYQRGFGGHFHNDNSLAALRDLPGVIVAVPARGRDAVGMLRTCVEEARHNGRVCLFVEPIARYMTRDLESEGDGFWSDVYPEPDWKVPLGELGLHGDGTDLAIVSYGNGYYLSMQAARRLEQHQGISSRVIDLRWLAPLPEEALYAAVRDCDRVLVVDECRRSGNIGEALVANFAERGYPSPQIGRIAADDCYIPLGDAATLGLPSAASIALAAEALCSKTGASTPTSRSSKEPVLPCG